MPETQSGWRERVRSVSKHTSWREAIKMRQRSRVVICVWEGTLYDGDTLMPVAGEDGFGLPSGLAARQDAFHSETLVKPQSRASNFPLPMFRYSIFSRLECRIV